MPLIIILDDRVTNRNIFSRLAASIAEDVAVEAFGDPAEALAQLEARTPDLVITDFKMPTMTGAEFTRRFRMLPGCEDVPVIAITVYEERAFRLEALEAGATDFLLSPVDHAEFLTRARNLLHMRRQALIIKSRASVLERELEDSERSREALLRDSRQRLAEVIDTVPALISAHDREGACVFLNAHMSAFAGIDPARAIGRPAAELVGAERAQRSLALDQLVFRSGRALPSYEEEVSDADGARHAFVVTKSPLSDADGRVIAVLTTALDITDRKKAESHLVHLAHHDALTGLANRTLLQDRMRREIARARRGDRFFALHLVDLDRFKSVNDALGHHRGDELLGIVAERLRRIVRETELKPAAHLTCVAATREEVDEVVRGYWAAGVRHIVALRGDPPEHHGGVYQPCPDGYAFAGDLVAGLKRVADFEISVAAFPETHPEAVSAEADLDNLKRKIDAGAVRAITQFFFDNDLYLRFVDRAAAAGITVPIVPGILPITNFARTVDFAAKCGAGVPGWLAERFAGLDHDPQTLKTVATDVASRQCLDLRDHGVSEFHFYTLNRAELTEAICRALGICPQPVEAPADRTVATRAAAS